MKKVLISLTLVFTLTFLVSCMQVTKGTESSIQGMGDVKKVKVITNATNVKNGCSTNTATLQSLNKGNKVDVINKVANWYAVRLPNKQIGFVPEKEVTPVVEEPEKKPATGTPTGVPTGDVTQGNLTADEQQMFSLVNQARKDNGLPAYKIDMETVKLARLKSQDMIDNNYFSHNSPTYGSPFDMMKKYGVDYVKAGENIAGNQNVANAHKNLMNSPGHRKNILSPDFTHVGIGIKNGGQYGKMFTQMFTSKPK